MRHVGPFPNGHSAGGLLAVLSARGIDAVMRDGELWVLDEDQIAEARRELERFVRQPASPDWRRAIAEARSRCEHEAQVARRELAERARLSWRRERRLRRAFQTAASSRPLTLVLLPVGLVTGWMGPHEPSVLLPLLASLYWLHELGTHVEALRGSRRFALLVLSLAGVSQLLLVAAGFGFAGLSGIAFGLLGFTVARAHLDPDCGLSVPRGLLPLMGAWLIACAAGAAPSAVFLAQSAGLVAGLLLGTLPVALARRASVGGHSR